MRILIYWEQESWGGVDTHLLELLQTWPDINDEFVLVTNYGNSGFERVRQELEQLPRIRFCQIHSCSHNELSRRLRNVPRFAWVRHLLHFFQPLTFFYMTQRLARIFKNLGPFDLLLADDGAYPAAWGCISAMFAAKKASISARILLVHHAALPPALFVGWFERWIDRALCKTASMIICVSQATRQTILNKREINDAQLYIRVIHNTIRPPAMLQQLQSNFSHAAIGHTASSFDLHKMLSLNREYTSTRLVGIVGRIQLYKGHEDLIFAFARLAPEIQKRLHLVIIGDGEEQTINDLKKLAQQLLVGQNVSFLGYIPGPATAIIQQLNLLVVATRSFEGFGLTLLEAMQVGTPILTTRVGAIPEFVNEQIGTLIPPCAPEALAAALTDFVVHQENWQTRAHIAQTQLANKQSSMALEYHRTFVECLSAHRE